MCEVVFDIETANYALTVSDIDMKRVIATLYFYVSPTESVNSTILMLADNYPEYIQPNYRIDINKVRNGKRIGRM